MSKQKTFWGTYYGNKRRHLWTTSGFLQYNAACGLFCRFGHPSRKGDKCKNCLRAIKN